MSRTNHEFCEENKILHAPMFRVISWAVSEFCDPRKTGKLAKSTHELGGNNALTTAEEAL